MLVIHVTTKKFKRRSRMIHFYIKNAHIIQSIFDNVINFAYLIDKESCSLSQYTYAYI